MTIATFNVNSIRSRVDLIMRWLREKFAVDLLSLQEIKCEEAQFPAEAFEELGYHLAINGQKRYNGVAICSKRPFDRIKTRFDDEILDREKRLIEVQIGRRVILNLYAPHGESDESHPKHLYKMAFYERLTRYLKEKMKQTNEIVLLGDMNVALEDMDVYDPARFEGTVGFLESEKEALKRLLEIGLHDCFREKHPDSHGFTWWDYRTAGIWRDEGMRIDYILSTDAIMRRCTRIEVDLWPRRRRSPTPSDHAPLVGEIA